jgi:N-dimethylarginine dimethylaminohydrolase
MTRSVVEQKNCILAFQLQKHYMSSELISITHDEQVNAQLKTVKEECQQIIIAQREINMEQARRTGNKAKTLSSI